MELFEINYFDRAKALFVEAFSFKKYKCMNGFFAFVTALVLLPLQLFCLGLGAFMLVTALVLRIAYSLVTSWHKIVTDEGQKVKHGSQVVIYALTWPFTFFAYFLSGIMLIGLAIEHVIFGCASYIWTLGGVKFRAFIGDSSEDCAAPAEGKYKAIIPIIFTIIVAVLAVALPILIALILFIVLYVNYMEAMFFATFWPIFAGLLGLTFLFGCVYSFFIYAKGPKSVE